MKNYQHPFIMIIFLLTTPFTSNSGHYWRESCPQSERTNMVAKIADTISNLKGKSASRYKRLASKFETSYFGRSNSLAEYQKKIGNSLEKLKLEYGRKWRDSFPARQRSIVAARIVRFIANLKGESVSLKGKKLSRNKKLAFKLERNEFYRSNSLPEYRRNIENRLNELTLKYERCGII